MDEVNHSHSQEERLQQEILADAHKRADKIVARAVSAANAARARAEKDASEQRERTLEQSRRESAQKANNIVQGIWMEERRMWLRQREERLDAFFASLLAEAEALKSDDSDRAKSLAHLSKEALDALGTTSALVAAVSPQDAALVTPAWLAKVAGQETLDIVVKADPTIRGGIRIATADDRELYDNTYAGRLRRLRDQFRRELAKE